MGRSHLVANTALGAGLLAVLHRLGEGVDVSGFGDLPVAGGLLADAAGWAQTGATWAWDWLFPHGMAPWYLVTAALLYWLGSLLPDIDNSSSMLGRRFHIPVPGPHRGVTHTDWLLLVLLLVSVPGPTRLVAFVWLGAWLHCELDGFSTAGRARFWPLGSWKVVTLGHGDRAQPCVVRRRSRRLSYRVGEASETVALGLCVALGAAGVLASGVL